MNDPRIDILAKQLINYSVALQKGEKVLIEGFDVPPDIIIALIREASKVGAIPLVELKNNQVARELYKNATEEQMKLIGDAELFRMKQMDAYIGIRGIQNAAELSDIPQEQMKLYQDNWFGPVHIQERVAKTRWVVLRYPTSAMAQMAQMSTEAFEKFYFDVCLLDYEKLSEAMGPMKELMERTDQVHIKGQGTDLRFSIKGIPVIKCDGQLNIPDGEIYSAPVKDSVEGVISYNTPSKYHGTPFENIKLQFREGKIVEASGTNQEKLNQIFDSDEGARYVGEFALGVNPYITKPMQDILFDEKIAGSFHFTPGNSYDNAFNGNKSAVHWDLVAIQTPEYGGGEIWFDGVLVRKDGSFVPDELKALNPENLIKKN